MTKKVLILGNKGMLGHVVKRYLSEIGEYEIIGIGRSDLDVLNDDISKILDETNPDIVINCIGLLIGCEDTESMKRVNSLFPHKLSELSKKYNYKLIHISTDCVFNGVDGYPYSENSILNPKDFYGASKAIGEVVDMSNLTIRTSIIGPEIRDNKTGLFEWVISNQSKSINGYENVIWSGVTTLELAKAIDYFIKKETTGLVNFSHGNISKYELLKLINSIYGLDIKINPVKEPVNNKTLVTSKNLYDDIEKKSFEDMLTELKKWY